MAVAIGIYTIGIALNYWPPALHALSLRSPQRLGAEVEGLDLRAELRLYTGAQFWVSVPLLFVWWALADL